jgi:hypothetical protein
VTTPVRVVSNDSRPSREFIEIDKRGIDIAEAALFARRNASKGYAILLIGNDVEIIQMARHLLTDVSQTGRTRLGLVIANGSGKSAAVYTNNGAVLFESKNNSEGIRANERSYSQIRSAIIRKYDEDIGPLVAASRQNDVPRPQR